MSNVSYSEMTRLLIVASCFNPLIFTFRQDSSAALWKVERGAVQRDAGPLGQVHLEAGDATGRERNLLRLLEVCDRAERGPAAREEQAAVHRHKVQAGPEAARGEIVFLFLSLWTAEFFNGSLLDIPAMQVVLCCWRMCDLTPWGHAQVRSVGFGEINCLSALEIVSYLTCLA
jgi:hypothetical protein